MLAIVCFFLFNRLFFAFFALLRGWLRECKYVWAVYGGILSCIVTRGFDCFLAL